MQQFIYFIQKYKYFLFFLLLELVALFFTINNHSFHKSRFISSANALTGGIFQKKHQLSEYLDLKEINKGLAEENAKLKNELELIKRTIDTTVFFNITDSLYRQKYTYHLAKAINNNFSSSFNFLTLNRGSENGINVEMAVTNHLGIVGVTDRISNGYARVRSILNKNSSINARIKGDTVYYGNLKWNGKDIRTLQLEDFPRQAVVHVGDTVITGGKSTIFPEGILVGTVSNVSPSSATTKGTIEVRLFNDMRNIEYVYVISNLDRTEIRTVEKQRNE